METTRSPLERMRRAYALGQRPWPGYASPHSRRDATQPRRFARRAARGAPAAELPQGRGVPPRRAGVAGRGRHGPRPGSQRAVAGVRDAGQAPPHGTGTGACWRPTRPAGCAAGWRPSRWRSTRPATSPATAARTTTGCAAGWPGGRGRRARKGRGTYGPEVNAARSRRLRGMPKLAVAVASRQPPAAESWPPARPSATGRTRPTHPAQRRGATRGGSGRCAARRGGRSRPTPGTTPGRTTTWPGSTWASRRSSRR